VTEQQRVEIEVPGDRQAVRSVADAFEGFATERELPVDLVQSVQIVLDEAVSNVVRHGYEANGLSGDVRVAVGIEEGTVTLQVVDTAPEFDPLGAPGPDTSLPIEQRPLGGLGILILRRLMDRVEYARDGEHNRLSAWKTIPAAESDGSTVTPDVDPDVG
jgi:serine/threonine-protein kinase RsbW